MENKIRDTLIMLKESVLLSHLPNELACQGIHLYFTTNVFLFHGLFYSSFKSFRTLRDTYDLRFYGLSKY